MILSNLDPAANGTHAILTKTSTIDSEECMIKNIVYPEVLLHA